MEKLIEKLNWRYATKKFDPTKKVAQKELDQIKEFVRLVPTSFGLQPLKVLIIENQELKQKLVQHANNQLQVADCSHLFVICHYSDIVDRNIDSYVSNMATIRNLDREKLAGFGNYMKTAMSEMSMEQKTMWCSKQAYIALGYLMIACAQLEIDSTPMEGFDPTGFDQVLGLNSQNLTAALIVPIGYRHEEDRNQYLKKVRRTNEELFEII